MQEEINWVCYGAKLTKETYIGKKEGGKKWLNFG